MRSFALAIAGLVALGHALPTAEAPSALEERQMIFGEPTTRLIIPGSDPAPVPSKPKKEKGNKWIFPIPTEDEEEEAASAALERRGGEPDMEIDELLAMFEALARQYTDRHPSINVYLILQQMAGLLAAKGHPTSIMFLGPAETTFKISDKARRQDGVFGIGGSCNVDDLIGLLLTYSSLRSIYGPNPPTAIQNLKEAIYAALTYCNMDPESGGIIPNPNVEGSPIKPDPARPGAPMKPDPASPGAPMRPEPARTGAPMAPEPRVTGAPLVPGA